MSKLEPTASNNTIVNTETAATPAEGRSTTQSSDPTVAPAPSAAPPDKPTPTNVRVGG